MLCTHITGESIPQASPKSLQYAWSPTENRSEWFDPADAHNVSPCGPEGKSPNPLIQNGNPKQDCWVTLADAKIYWCFTALTATRLPLIVALTRVWSGLSLVFFQQRSWAFSVNYGECQEWQAKRGLTGVILSKTPVASLFPGSKASAKPQVKSSVSFGPYWIHRTIFYPILYVEYGFFLAWTEISYLKTNHCISAIQFLINY